MVQVYFFFFAAVGALIPFLTLHYHNLGLSGTEISILMSVTPAMLFISQPIFGPLADRSGHRGLLLSRMFLIVAATGGLLVTGTSFWPLLALMTLWAFFSGPLVPIADSIALGEMGRTGVSYPRLRLWGSVGFLVVTMTAGSLYNHLDGRWAFFGYFAFNLVAWYYARRLPAEGVSSTRRAVWPDLKQLLSNRYLFLFLVLTAVLQSTNAAHQTFFSVRMAEIGATSGMIGMAWGIGALMEVPVWLVLGRVAKRVGVRSLLVFSGVMFGVRFWLYSVITVPEVLAGLQMFQAFTFAIFMPTAVMLVGELTPPHLRTTGQALLFLVKGGIASIFGTLAAGRVVDAIGTAGLYRSISYVAVVAGLGFLLLAFTRGAATGERAEESDG